MRRLPAPDTSSTSGCSNARTGFRAGCLYSWVSFTRRRCLHAIEVVVAGRLAGDRVSACGGAAPARGQTVASAGVTGIVRDSSDALVPGVTVEIRNHATNQTWQTVSDAHGRFRLPYLPVGDYHLSAQLSGFATTNAGLSLERRRSGGRADRAQAGSGERVRDRLMHRRPWSRRGGPRLAAVITPREVDSLPLNGRNYLDLALLAPNVSRTNLRTTDRFAETSAVPGTGVSVSGQRNLNNNFVLDGLSANDDAADLAGMSLSQEVVREFEVMTSGGGAEFGRASSGTISVVTQSGTNRYAGRAYEFFRNDAFDTQNPLATRKDPLNQNQYRADPGRADRHEPHVLVRERGADPAGSHRRRHDRARRR